MDRQASTYSARFAHRSRLGLMVAALLVCAGLMQATSAPAHAAAYGCSSYGARTVGGYSLPSGVYCMRISGNGTYIPSVDGSISATRICNFSITAEAFDANWRWKKTYTSPVNRGCTSNTGMGIWIGRYLPQITGTNHGYICSTLRVANQRMTSVCHYIKP